MVYIFPHFAIYSFCVCSNVSDFNNRNQFLTPKILKKVINIIKNFLNSTSDTRSRLLNKILVLKLLQQGISEPVFHVDLVYKFQIIVGSPTFSDQFKTINKRFKMGLL